MCPQMYIIGLTIKKKWFELRKKKFSSLGLGAVLAVIQMPVFSPPRTRAVFNPFVGVSVCYTVCFNIYTYIYKYTHAHEPSIVSFQLSLT